MPYINNYSEQIELGPATTSALLTLPDGAYRLTLSDSARTRWEIVDAAVVGGVATLTRALEGTTAQTWPAGSVVYCAVTAGQLNALLARIEALEAGGGVPDGALADASGNLLVDGDGNTLTTGD